jgi:hypothetical protein
MPVYLCQPGSGATEPWRHGIQVYAAPFYMDDHAPGNSNSNTASNTNRGQQGTDGQQQEEDDEQQQEQGAQQIQEAMVRTFQTAAGVVTVVSAHAPPRTSNQQNTTFTAARSSVTTSSYSPTGRPTAGGIPIRRVRHAEVVLVDDVCLAYDRYWLRLCWPGHKGGFAGYIALGKVGQGQVQASSSSLLQRTNATPQGMLNEIYNVLATF